MSKPDVHIEAKRSWFSGKATTLCGITYPAGGHKTFWVTAANCRVCIAIEKAGK
jgi:hypothetical protein